MIVWLLPFVSSWVLLIHCVCGAVFAFTEGGICSLHWATEFGLLAHYALLLNCAHRILSVILFSDALLAWLFLSEHSWTQKHACKFASIHFLENWKWLVWTRIWDSSLARPSALWLSFLEDFWLVTQPSFSFLVGSDISISSSLALVCVYKLSRFLRTSQSASR